MKQFLYDHKYYIEQDEVQKLIEFLTELLETDCSYITEFHLYFDEDNQRIAQVKGLGESGQIKWGTF